MSGRSCQSRRRAKLHITSKRLRGYTSAIVAWFQISGTSPSSNAVIHEASGAPVRRNDTVANTPSESAVVIPENKAAPSAGDKVGHTIPMNRRVRRIQSGYPGGCPTPRVQAAVTSSPESSPVTVGARVAA